MAGDASSLLRVEHIQRHAADATAIEGTVAASDRQTATVGIVSEVIETTNAQFGVVLGTDGTPFHLTQEAVSLCVGEGGVGRQADGALALTFTDETGQVAIGRLRLATAID